MPVLRNIVAAELENNCLQDRPLFHCPVKSRKLADSKLSLKKMRSQCSSGRKKITFKIGQGPKVPSQVSLVCKKQSSHSDFEIPENVHSKTSHTAMHDLAK